MAHTMAEAILASASGNDHVSPGDHVVCEIDVAMTQDIHTPGVAHLLDKMGVEELHDPENVVVVLDHEAPSHTAENATEKSMIREFVAEHPDINFYDVGTGISHEVLSEKGYIRPGELVIGTDSHTTTHGAFGAASTGIGDTDMAYALATGEAWFRVPETIEFHVEGTFADGVSAKDLILHIAGEFGTDVARYKAIEFRGPAIDALSIDDRMTLTNMTIELGGKFGFTPIDDSVTDYIDARTDEPYEVVTADTDATYSERHTIDVSDLEPQVAVPHDVENVYPISAVDSVDVDQVFLGSCTNGKFEDLEAAAAVLDGNEVAPMTRLLVTPASREIYLRAEEAGIIRTFNEAGAIVTNSTCGACPGLGMGVLGEEEVCFATQNRNFRGRMGHNDSEIYLGSPEMAAATAITGRLTSPQEVCR